MDSELLRAILNCNGDKNKPKTFDKVFMYVKNYCPHSIHAASKASDLCADVRVIDVMTNKYVSPKDLKQPLAMNPDQHYIQAYSILKKNGMTTVPQMFVSSDGWKYTGGRDDFDNLTDRHSSIESVQSMFDQVKF